MTTRKHESERKEMKIENGIPVPARAKGLTVILRKLKVGQSVILPAKGQSARTVARYALGKGKHATRATTGGTRVWRLK